MKKILKVLMAIGLVILLVITVYKLNLYHYQKNADEKIRRVIEIQGADFSQIEVVLDSYSFKSGKWEKDIFFKEDPDIRYLYSFDRSLNEVKVDGRYKNMSLDLAQKEPRYPLIVVKFNKDGKVTILQSNIN